MLLYRVVGANNPRTDPLLPLFMGETPKAYVSGRWRPYRTFTLISVNSFTICNFMACDFIRFAISEIWILCIPKFIQSR